MFCSRYCIFVFANKVAGQMAHLKRTMRHMFLCKYLKICSTQECIFIFVSKNFIWILVSWWSGTASITIHEKKFLNSKWLPNFLRLKLKLAMLLSNRRLMRCLWSCVNIQSHAIWLEEWKIPVNNWCIDNEIRYLALPVRFQIPHGSWKTWKAEIL